MSEAAVHAPIEARCPGRGALLPVLAIGAFLVATVAVAQPSTPPTAECCNHKELADQYGIIWTGLDPVMEVERLVAYAAPVLWFSPDEPLLKAGPRHLRGKDIAIPTSFPFEEASETPIVYDRVRRVLQRLDEPGEGTYVADPEVRGHSKVDLRKVVAADVDFFFYYPMDMGGNPHKHDVESVEVRIGVGRTPACSECPYVVGLMRVSAKAHGIQWFDNTLAWMPRPACRCTSWSRRASTCRAPIATRTDSSPRDTT